MVFVILTIAVLSIILAIRSMVDFEPPKDFKKMLDLNKIKGSIVFFKNRTKHYH